MGADLASETGVKNAARSYQVGATSATPILRNVFDPAVQLSSAP